MNDKQKAMLASYGRSFLVAITVTAMNGEASTKAIILAGLAAIVGPGIRSINRKDPAFGMIADKVDVELDKLLRSTSTKKKTAPKKKTK